MVFTTIWLHSIMEMVKPEISKIILNSLLDLPSTTSNHAGTPKTGMAASRDLPENGTNKCLLPVHSFKKSFKILMIS